MRIGVVDYQFLNRFAPLVFHLDGLVISIISYFLLLLIKISPTHHLHDFDLSIGLSSKYMTTILNGEVNKFTR